MADHQLERDEPPAGAGLAVERDAGAVGRGQELGDGKAGLDGHGGSIITAPTAGTYAERAPGVEPVFFYTTRCNPLRAADCEPDFLHGGR
jgi:hypothetical protein